MTRHPPTVLIRGGGDLATGVAVRLHRCGFHIVITEIEQPLAVRRLVSLAEAVYAGEVQIEDVRGRHVEDLEAARRALQGGVIPVLVDPEAACRESLLPDVLVDGRMLKIPPDLGRTAAPLVVGLGPGFTAGVDCHAVVETNRGHRLGRVYWDGCAETDTGVPEPVYGYDEERVLRAPIAGRLQSNCPLGTVVRKGEAIAVIGGVDLVAPFDGVLRGLMHDGLMVEADMKVGDLDPRMDPAYCRQISDKSLAVGGGVLEAVLSVPALRGRLAD
jgi:xanthine dehydrogenase accessory factor